MEFVKSKERIIAITSINQSAYSETFITAHKDLLPFKIKYYFGGELPQFLDGHNINKQSRAQKFRTKFLRRIAKKKRLSEKEEILATSFRKHGVSAVLAEYGTGGAMMVNICKQLQLPLFVHFHGYDAAVTDVN